MKKELINFIRKNELSPFNSAKTQLKPQESIYKTRDAKSIHTKTLAKISQHFIFSDTANLLHYFTFTNNPEEVLKRQKFFQELKKIPPMKNSVLSKIKNPKPYWKPEYDITVVTEDVDTFTKLKEMGCPVQIIVSETDVALLESKDVVQIIDCPEYGIALESLPQSVFIKNINEVYMERHLETFSGWLPNLDILSQNPSIKSIKEIIEDIIPLRKLMRDSETEILDRDEVEGRVIEANKKIEDALKGLTLTGMSLVEILSKGILPDELKELIDEILLDMAIPEQIIVKGIPLKLDHNELEKMINEQEKNQFTSLAEEITEYSDKLKNIPEILIELAELLLFYDFIAGITNFINERMNFSKISEDFTMENILNLLIENPEPISFNLSREMQCSVLTGANSGGKTTLIEHVLQIISLTQMGMPVYGEVKIPLFEEVYYFAKNKGSASKGAFETLLTQMSKIKPGNKTLILADEIEAVTEPGVAGSIIAATAKYFINQNCYLIIATHLGHEIQKIIPEKTRIDGIEAKGLTEDFELIVDHNPVLGRLAHSTPELIVEKMANVEKKEYFQFLDKFLKKQN